MAFIVWLINMDLNIVIKSSMVYVLLIYLLIMFWFNNYKHCEYDPELLFFIIKQHVSYMFYDILCFV